MNLFLALFWLICAVVLLAYEQSIGPTRFRLRVAGHSFSWAWLMLLLVLYNLKRWWWIRSYRLRQRAVEIDRANREWERRRRAEMAGPPDPNFIFTDEPPPSPNHGIADQPPSSN